jgi:TatD DNase family protein
MAEQFIKQGFYIGVGGTVTHKNNKKASNVLKRIGIGHVVVETDSPYLSPEEKRSEINTPMNLKYITRKIAEELDMDEDEVIEVTTKNAKELFRI